MFDLSLYEPADGSLIGRGESRPGEDVMAAILRVYREATGDFTMSGDPEFARAHGDKKSVVFQMTLVRGVDPDQARESDRRPIMAIVERRDDEPP